MVLHKHISGRIVGDQTVVYDPSTDKHFLVTSVSNPAVDKTFVQRCYGNGEVIDRNEVYTLVPADHIKVLGMLYNDELTSENMNIKII
jgi:hypothetical protein